MNVFGPIPSRRLGRSLGINNIPFKNCSYSCVYCQVGLTNHLSIKRKKFYDPEEIYYKVGKKIDELNRINEKIDFITFVPDGEPTLDINLGIIIKKLKVFGHKIAVITNSSLITNKSVQDELMQADLVSLKIDTANLEIWHRINRPHGLIILDEVKKGILEFRSSYKGIIFTETMLVKSYNDYFTSLYNTGEFIKQINPKKAYITIPARPPAENINSPEREYLKSIKQILKEIYENIEIIDYNEGTDFTFTSDFETELLSIISVHPMSKDAVKLFIKKANMSRDIVDKLIKGNIIEEILFEGNSFFKIKK